MATVEPVALPAGESIRPAELGDIARTIELANCKMPLCYPKRSGPDGKKIIAIRPAIAPLIAKLSEWYARGEIWLKEAARKAHVTEPACDSRS
jgi:hypothetical protein